jgi:tetratricopeptide (TPR) repeat protein
MKSNLSIALLLLVGLLCQISCKSDTKKKNIPVTSTNNPILDELNQRIEKNSKDHQALYKRAQIYYDKEAYDESIVDLKNAIKIDSLQPMYYHLLADNYLDYYKSREALETMEKVTTLFPKRIESLLKQAEFQLILKQHSEAQLTVQRILQIEPQNAEAYLMGGMMFKDLGDETRARAGLQKAIELGLIRDIDKIDAFINLGQLNIKKDPKLAEKYIENALRIDSVNIPAMHAKADLYQASNKLNDAIKVYRKIVNIDQNYSAAYFNTGILYLEMDSLDKAIKNFDIATKVEPTEANYYFYRGKAKEKLGQKAEAKADYEQALKFNPANKDALNAIKIMKK